MGRQAQQTYKYFSSVINNVLTIIMKKKDYQCDTLKRVNTLLKTNVTLTEM